MLSELKDKVVIVTGAGSGIGFESVKSYLSAGAKVIATDINVKVLKNLNEAKNLLIIESNLRLKESAKVVVDKAVKHFGKIDVLLNNAGVAPVRNGFLSVSDKQWEQLLELNFYGYVRMSRAVIPHMVDGGGGSIIHIASEAARMPNIRLPDYSVAKAAILMLSKILSKEFTCKGVRSNVISPAFIRTGIYDKPGGLADALASEFNMDREDALKHYVELNDIPAGRLGAPSEVSSMAIYLASDKARFISGSNFVIDGGVTPVV